MKYGIIRFDGTDTDKFEKVIINIGDAAQRIAIENIYKKMGIPDEEIIVIDYYEMDRYDGEYVVVPVNLLVIHDSGNEKFFKFSPKIIPVFLGISFSDSKLGEEQLEILKRYQPIGCRDQKSLELMTKHGISAYCNGCLAMTLPRRKELPTQTKVFFADVPIGVKEYIPKELYGNIEFVQQEVFSKLSELPNASLKDYTNRILEKYYKEARLIVTSRFHGAVIAMALGIPVIVTLEKYTYRFSWIKNMVPFYTSENFSEIKWDPVPPNFEELKQEMVDIAISRLRETYDKYYKLYAHSEKMETAAGEQDYINQIPCYQDAIDYIRKTWNAKDCFTYSFWGINQNAEEIYQFINKYYPNAVYKNAYDMFRSVEFHDKVTKYPHEFELDEFIFVTAYIAAQMAPTYFKKHNVDKSRYYLCKRRFISAADLSGM